MEHPQSTSVREIPLSRGKVALVDAADYDWLSQWRWTYHSRGYAHRRVGVSADGHQVYVFMHRVILGLADGRQGDHRNGNKLDNRRANLRPATQSQQNWNVPPRLAKPSRTSRFKGVSRNKKLGRWTAFIHGAGPRYLGLFDTEEAAARAYDAAARERYGEFAWLNFPDEEAL